MRTWVRALPIAATVLLVGCSPAPAGPTRPARPADGRLPPVMVPHRAHAAAWLPARI